MGLLDALLGSSPLTLSSAEALKFTGLSLPGQVLPIQAVATLFLPFAAYELGDSVFSRYIFSMASGCGSVHGGDSFSFPVVFHNS